jgi:hypothetical protein
MSPADLEWYGPSEQAFLGSMTELVSWQCDTNGCRIKTSRRILNWTVAGVDGWGGAEYEWS